MEKLPINRQKIEELADLLDLAKVTEQQAKELCQMAEEFARKWEFKLEGRKINHNNQSSSILGGDRYENI
jgi:hypothetical protein